MRGPLSTSLLFPSIRHKITSTPNQYSPSPPLNFWYSFIQPFPKHIFYLIPSLLILSHYILSFPTPNKHYCPTRIKTWKKNKTLNSKTNWEWCRKWYHKFFSSIYFYFSLFKKSNLTFFLAFSWRGSISLWSYCIG